MEGRTAVRLAVAVFGISLFAAGAQAQVTVLLNGTAAAATQTYNNQQITISVTGAQQLFFAGTLHPAIGECPVKDLA